jgi:hypothetical protein
MYSFPLPRVLHALARSKKHQKGRVKTEMVEALSTLQGKIALGNLAYI